MAKLFDPITVGELRLPNRIFMAPLTRSRAVDDRVPNDLMRTYYTQRASAGLILSEATAVTPQGVGYADTPGIWSEAQIEGWRKITQAVHHAGGHIFMQLWHVGRVSDPIFLNGDLPVAPSAIAPAGHVSLVRPQRPYVTPRALELDEIPGVVAAYAQGAANAKKAGFDGVELHGANGYLLDQFLQDSTNKRTDRYGGSIENRARLMLEATDAVLKVWGPGRVGMHLAPRRNSHDMGIQIRQRPSAMWPSNWASESSPSSAPERRSQPTVWGRSSKRPSAGFMSPTRPSARKAPRRSWPGAMQMRLPGANYSLPTLTFPSALRPRRSSTNGMRTRSMAVAPRDIPTIPPSKAIWSTRDQAKSAIEEPGIFIPGFFFMRSRCGVCLS